MTRQQLEHFIEIGKVFPTDDVWTASLKDWTAAAEIFVFRSKQKHAPLPPRVDRRPQDDSRTILTELLTGRYARTITVILGFTLSAVTLFYLATQYATSGLAPSGATTAERAEALEILKLSFDCTQNTFTEKDSRSAFNLQSEFVGSADSFISRSHAIKVEQGRKLEADIDLTVHWANIVHIDVMDQLMFLYCKDCSIDAQTDNPEMITKDLVETGVRSSTMFVFCDKEAAANAAAAIEVLTDLPVSKWIFDPPNAPVKEDNLFMKRVIGSIFGRSGEGR